MNDQFQGHECFSFIFLVFLVFSFLITVVLGVVLRNLNHPQFTFGICFGSKVSNG